MPICTVHFGTIQRFEGASKTKIYIVIGCIIIFYPLICDFKFKRTENHNFTITTNTSQHVEFFHSLIFEGLFYLFCSRLGVSKLNYFSFFV